MSFQTNQDPSYCKSCELAISERLERFAAARRIRGAAPIVRDVCLAQVNVTFPGVFELLLHPDRWVPKDFSWFPVVPSKSTSIRFVIEFVVAPLPFAAACVRVQCKLCARHTRVININSSFLILCSHLLAASLGTCHRGDALRQLLVSLYTSPVVVDAYEAPKSLPRVIISAGMAWLMMHEFSHVVGLSRIRPETLSVPHYAKQDVASELSADVNAFYILLHRLHANSPLDRTLPATLAVGVELILRCLAIAVANPNGGVRQGDDVQSVIQFSTPSPLLRWQTIEDACERLSKLGLMDAAIWSQDRKQVFGGWQDLSNELKG